MSWAFIRRCGSLPACGKADTVGRGFRPTPMGTAHLVENRILGTLAFGQFGQRLTSDQLSEMRGLLMCREGSFVLKHLVEEKFRGLAA